MSGINLSDLPPLDGTDSDSPLFFADRTDTPDKTALLILTGLAEIHRFGDMVDIDAVGTIFAKAPTEHHLTASFLIIESLLTLLHARADIAPTEAIETARRYLASASERAHNGE